MEKQEANKIALDKSKKLKAILGDLENHMTQINKEKDKLRNRSTSFFSPNANESLLEEITVPPLKLLKESKS